MLSAFKPLSHAVYPAGGQRTHTTHSDDHSLAQSENVFSGKYNLADIEGRYGGVVPQPAPAVLTLSTGRNKQLNDPDNLRGQHPVSGQRSLTHDTCNRSGSPPQRQVNTTLLSSSQQQTPRQSPRHSPDRPIPNPPAKGCFMPTLTGDKNGEIKIEAKGGKLGSWFKGNSAPVNLRVPVEGPIEPQLTPPVPPMTGLQKKRSMGFSLFGSGSRASTVEPQSPQTPAVDELFSLDIHSALFPTGSPDPFSPSAFKDLWLNAEGLLSRMQTAYKQRTMEVREVNALMSVQVDELEGAQTRARHLKMQLDDMAVKSLEQERAINELADELAKEKQRRREEEEEEEEARKRSLSLVRRSEFGRTPDEVEPEVTPRKRCSGGSGMTSASDSGFESECESSTDSIFSAGYGTASPAGTMFSSITGSASPDMEKPMRFPTGTSVPNLRRVSAYSEITPIHIPPIAQPKSAFQKVFSSISSPPVAGSEAGHPDADTTSRQSWGCSNCLGGRSAMAWGIVGNLRDENRGLKEKVGRLEGAVEACLDLVGGLTAR
ncbi:MAG: hypothetical protein M1839_007576 [Geoglossum umbratile]|nr:MAG: hypothetical protein M1839_007576 [Geoglossum umbratile]